MPAPEWFDFKNPDYDSVFLERTQRLQKIRKTPGMLEGLKEYYKDNPADFINDWGCTHDPRNAEIGLPTIIPFLLFPKQEEYVHWIVDLWHQKDDGLAEKSRDMGVTWLCVAIAVWMWLFHDGVVVGFGSRKEEYVDKLGDPKSIFWKIRKFIELLPKEFRPAGYAEKSHAPYMRVINPDNESVIVGESGDNIGRGNRTSIYFKDESAYYERPALIDAALSQTSNCKIDVSTPNGSGNPFYRKRHSGHIPVFTFHWRDDPRKNEAWYMDQKKKNDPVILAQEVDINYSASVSDSWFEGDLIQAAMSIGPADIENYGHYVVSIDAAHYGNDESVINFRKGRVNLPQVTLNKIDGQQLGGRVEEECRNLEATGEYISGIVIELDGPGVSCYDYLKREGGQYRDKIIGLHTGKRLKDNINYNLRALLCRRAKEFFETTASVQNDPEFKAQLSSLKFKYKDGLLLMQPKDQYKKEYGRSPDRADAFILSFADIDLVENETDWYDQEYEYQWMERDSIGGY